jgi:hypothetical protein
MNFDSIFGRRREDAVSTGDGGSCASELESSSPLISSSSNPAVQSLPNPQVARSQAKRKGIHPTSSRSSNLITEMPQISSQLVAHPSEHGEPLFL